MASATGSADGAAENPPDEEADHNILIRIALAIRGSFLLFVAAGSILMIVAAIIIEAFALKRGVIQAMFLIWGISGLLYAGGGFLLLRLIGYR